MAAAKSLQDWWIRWLAEQVKAFALSHSKQTLELISAFQVTSGSPRAGPREDDPHKPFRARCRPARSGMKVSPSNLASTSVSSMRSADHGNMGEYVGPSDNRHRILSGKLQSLVALWATLDSRHDHRVAGKAMWRRPGRTLAAVEGLAPHDHRRAHRDRALKLPEVAREVHGKDAIAANATVERTGYDDGNGGRLIAFMTIL